MQSIEQLWLWLKSHLLLNANQLRKREKRKHQSIDLLKRTERQQEKGKERKSKRAKVSYQSGYCYAIKFMVQAREEGVTQRNEHIKIVRDSDCATQLAGLCGNRNREIRLKPATATRTALADCARFKKRFERPVCADDSPKERVGSSQSCVSEHALWPRIFETYESFLGIRFFSICLSPQSNDCCPK